LRYAVDASARALADADRLRMNQQIGYAIEQLRRRRGVHADRLEGLSSRQVRRIEQGVSTPRASTLRKLAEAHGLSLEDYLGALSAWLGGA
jgi:transcriptional regulator with XRE-family HTH domain